MRVFFALAALPLLVLLAPAGRPASAATPSTASGLRLSTAPDGALEVRNGDALLTRVALKTPLLRRGSASLRDVTVAGHRLAELRVPVRGASAEEIWIGEIPSPDRASPAPSPRVVWSGLTGARDADGESSVWIEVTPERVVEYQTAAGVDRCDGIPPRLFPRAYDFAAGRFRPIVSSLPPPGSETLIGHRGDPAMPAGRPIADFHFVAASTTRGAGSDARSLTPPVELDDGNPATSWAEGLGGDGRGEFLTARAAAAGYPIRGLRILPGDGASAQAYHQKNRVRRLQIALGPAPGQRFDVELPEGPAADADHWRDPYWVPLPKPMTSSCVTIVITAVTPGTDAAPPKNYGTTAIGEVAIFTDADGPDGVNRLVSDLVAAPDCASRLPLVVGLGEAAVLPTAQAVLTSKGPARECLVEALTSLSPAPKSPIVVDALTAAVIGASEKEERLVATALGRAAAPPVGELAALLAAPSAEIDDRSRAARILGGLDDDAAAAALLAAVGDGPPALRASIVQAAGAARRMRAEAVLAALAAAPQREEQTAARAADLARILPAAVKRTPERRAEAITALRATLAVDRPFELRARAIVALGALGAQPGDGHGEIHGSGRPDPLVAPQVVSDDPILRYLATRELGDFKDPGGGDPRPALRAALDDQDPRVRETAALGLAKQGDLTAGGALITGAKQEPWPFVRRAELQALGQLCVAGGADLMIRATERDVDEVRRAALIGLGRCKDPRARTILLHTLERRQENASLRALSAGILGESGDRGATPEVAAALHDIVVDSEADLALGGVAMATLRALARLGGPDAVKAAVALAGDAHHPFRAAAAEALGLLCDPGPGNAALHSLAASGDPSLVRAAQRAEKRCAK
jgi:HEAT repeat protein